MYTFTIKGNGPDLDFITTRAMLALAAITAMVYSNGQYYYFNLFASVSLFVAAIFIKLLLVKFSLNKYLLLIVAAVVLFIVTHSFVFAVILLIYGYLVKFLYQKPTIQITNESITIRKLFASPVYQWDQFSNIILKDGLLTLDFKNNKLMQLNIDEKETEVDEVAFNDFCRGLFSKNG